MLIWECSWLVSLTSEYANLVLFLQHIGAHCFLSLQHHWKQAQQHTGKLHLVSLPKDNLTLEFIKNFLSPLHKKKTKPETNVLFQAHGTPGIADRSHVELTWGHTHSWPQLQTILRSQVRNSQFSYFSLSQHKLYVFLLFIKVFCPL